MDSGRSAAKLRAVQNFRERRMKREKRYLNVLLTLSVFMILGLTNCSSDSSPTGGNGNPDPTPTPLTFNDYIRPLFQNRCSSSSCHGTSPGQGGFSVANYASVLAGGVNGSGIIPGQPQSSNVYLKLTAAPPFGNRMPQGGPFFSQAKLDSISMWIIAGAPES